MHRERGFTLVELLVAVTILAFTVMTVFAIYTQATVGIRRAKNRTLAANYAQQMMEIIRSSPYAVSNYHGLSTTSELLETNPVHRDLLRWKTILQSLSEQANGRIIVKNEPYIQVVTVEIAYNNHGIDTVSTLTLKIPAGAL